jgi:hypothetical protein
VLKVQSQGELVKRKGSAMGTISADAFRRIYLLYLLGRFQRGSFGHVRLQKVAYVAERDYPQFRPFKYKRYHFGQYSEQLNDLKDQLASMGYVAAVPLHASRVIRFKVPQSEEVVEINFGGNRYYVREGSSLAYYREVLAAISPSVPSAIERAVHDYGYLKEEELLKRCYQFPEFIGLADEDIIFESTLGDTVEIDLPDEECEELEAAMNPRFVISMSRLATALEETDLDLTKVRKLEQLPVLGA